MNKFILLSLAVAAIGISAHARRISNRNVGKKMVCYVGTWAVYRPGDGKFEMEDIDPQLCTHIMCGFTKLENNEITVFDPWGDLKDEWGGGKGMYKRFTDLKQQNPELKALIAIGGWNEGSTKYSEMASSPSSRSKFVKSIVPFLEKHNFDGLDLDWEYPTQRGGKPEDREHFSELVQELRQELDRAGKGYLLTAAVSPNTKTVEIAYEVPVISKHLDFINVMCYDYHGFWEGHEFTGHNTPLYRHPLDDQFEPTFNANDTVTFWLEAGLPKEKLIMGMATYGRGFTLAKAENHGLYAEITGGVPQGPYTRQPGIWGYNEICEKYMTEQSDWEITIDPYIKAPYAYNGRNWIGYEDVESIYYKAEYARNMDLGGAMVWSLETDDFKGKCHGEKYILLRTIVATLNGGGMPSIPERPNAIYAEAEPQEDNEIVPSPTTMRTTRRPAGDDPYTTTRRPRPGPGNGGSNNNNNNNDQYTTTRRPRPGQGGSGSGSSSSNNNDDYTTTRRQSSGGSGGSGGSSGNRRTTRPPSNPGSGSGSGECQSEGLMPSGNCSTFYNCVRRGNRFEKIEQMCPAGTAFNPDIQGCDHKDNVPGCGLNVKSSDSFRSMGHN